MSAKIEGGAVSPTSLRTQARIVAATVDIVARHGLSGTTLANVAAAAGVSQGVVVFHFHSKEGLLAETLRRLTEEYRTAWSAVATAPDPLDRLVGLVRADFSPAVCTRKKIALWFAFWGEAAARPLWSRICAQSEQARWQVMERCCRELQPDAGPGHAADLAHSIDGLTNGLWLQLHLQPDGLSRDRALEVALAHLRLLLPTEAERI